MPWVGTRHRRLHHWFAKRLRQLPKVSPAKICLFCDYEGHFSEVPGSDDYSVRGTEVLLSLLSEHNANMTFAVVADLCRTQPELVKAIAQQHEIGCHGYLHERPRELSYSELTNMLDRANECFTPLGIKPTGFRSPQSAWSLKLINTLPQHGYHWSVERGRWMRPYRLNKHLIRCDMTSDDFGLITKRHNAKTLINHWQKAITKADKQGEGLVCLAVHDWIVGKSTAFQDELAGFVALNKDRIIPFTDVWQQRTQTVQ